MISDELEGALKVAEAEGCSCDLLYGYICGIHAAFARIRLLLKAEEK